MNSRPPISRPEISVIIPTRNRGAALAAALACLAAQEIDPSCFEVIVVDDGGSDDTEAVVARSYPFTAQYHRQTNQGAVVARRTGVALAQGRIFVFLDDDITVGKQTIAAFAEELARPPRAVVIGALRPPPYPDNRLFRDLYGQLMATGPGRDIGFLDCLGGILAVTREDYFHIGGWQDVAHDGRGAWCDVDFGYRGHLLGYRFRRAAGAVGYHDDRAIQDWPTYCRQQEKAAEQAVLLFRKHPALEGHIPAFRDKGPIRWQTDGARLIGKKLLRQALSSRPSMGIMSGSIGALERRGRLSGPLVLLYRWTISGHLYRGYRRGLRNHVQTRGAP